MKRHLLLYTGAGIGRLWPVRNQWPALAGYFARVAAFSHKRLDAYPGSPLLIAGTLRAHDRAVFLERHPEEAALLRDNLRHRAVIERSYLRAIGRARSEIIIANAYFVPGGQAIVGAVNVPIIYKSVEWWNTLHQGSSVNLTKSSMAETMLWGMLLMAMCFWMYSIAVAFMRVRTIMLERERNTDWVKAELANIVAGDEK